MAEIVLTLSEDHVREGSPPPLTWDCVDCGKNTAPTWPGRDQAKPGVSFTASDRCEVYALRPLIWAKAGMDEWDGCLCVGCIEKRLGRRLKPKDFDRNHIFNRMPVTPRLCKRRGR